MLRPVAFVFCLAVLPIAALGQNYQSTVMSLNPTHYWQLNETTVGMAVDSVGSLDGTHAGDYAAGVAGEVGVPGPDRDQSGGGMDLPGLGDSNLAFGAYDAASIDLGPGAALGNSVMTVSTWFQIGLGGAGSQGGDRVWTNNQTDPNTSFQITFGAGLGDTAANLVIGLNPAINGFPATGLPSGSGVGNFHIADSTLVLKDEQWHHIVASRNGNNIEDVLVVVDGVHYDVDTWSDSTDTWGTTGSNAHIATRTPGDGGPSQHALNGRIDEVAVWLGRQLTIQESIALYNSALSTGPSCDIDGNGSCGISDLDALYDDIAAGTTGGPSDIDGSGTVDNDDIGPWLDLAGTENGKTYLPGDNNLDGDVGGPDFTALAVDFGNSNADPAQGPSYWGNGNYDGNGSTGQFEVGGADFTALALNFGHVSVNSVPEPGSLSLLLLGTVLFWRRKA